MKIIVESAAGANRFIAHSYFTALGHAGYNVVWFDPDGKSPFDLFQEHPDTDLFIGHTWRLNRALVKNLISRPYMKVVLFANHYGSGDSNIDRTKFPIEFASPAEREFVKQLLDNNIRPLLICQYDNKYVGNTHDLWEKELGVACHGIKLSADITQYFPSEKDSKYACDIFYCGGRWEYKAQSIDPHLKPLCYPGTTWNIKIVGSGGWDVPNYLGQANEDTIRRFYTNAKIVPALFEPHVVWGGIPDLPQRIYQAGACGAFQICQNAAGLDDVFNDGEIVVVNSPEEFFDRCVYFLNHQEETIPYRVKSIDTIIDLHTNFHRASELFKLLSLDYSSLMSKIDELHQRYCNA